MSVSEVLPYFQKRAELWVINGLIFWNLCIIIPPQIRERVVEILHFYHPEIQRMKRQRQARQDCYWPKVDKDIENCVRNCDSCNSTQKVPRKTLLYLWLKTEKPWARLHADFVRPIKGKYYLILIDSMLKWSEVFCLNSINAKSTIESLNDVFARFGIPQSLLTDNGPPFQPSEFSTFCIQKSIKHMFSPLYHL